MLAVMLALIARVWHQLPHRLRQERSEESISFTIPVHDLKDLQEMVHASPGVRLEYGGWAAISCKVTGSNDALAAFAPKLTAWQLECGSRDAW